MVLIQFILIFRSVSQNTSSIALMTCRNGMYPEIHDRLYRTLAASIDFLLELSLRRCLIFKDNLPFEMNISGHCQMYHSSQSYSPFLVSMFVFCT